MQSFKGLEDLHLLTHGRLPVIEGFWGSVIHYQSTLKQLVYHESPIDFNAPFDKASLPWGSKGSGNIIDGFPDLQLKYMGLCLLEKLNTANVAILLKEIKS